MIKFWGVGEEEGVNCPTSLMNFAIILVRLFISNYHNSKYATIFGLS